MPHRGEANPRTIASCQGHAYGGQLVLSFAHCTRFLLLIITALGSSHMATDTAQAQCGHYVVIMNPSDAAMVNGHTNTSGHLPMQNPAGLLADNPASDSPHKPCNGPMCRGQAPRSFPPAMPVPASPAMDHQAWVTAPITLPCDTCTIAVPREFHLPCAAYLPVDEPPPRF